MIRKVKHFIKVLPKVIEAKQIGTMPFYSIDKVIDGVPIVFNTTVIYYSNVEFGLIAIGEEGPIIFLEEDLEDSIIDFVIQHELGHLKKGHLDKLKSMSPIKISFNRFKRFFNVPKEEYEADLYSANIVGFDNAINALIHMYEETGSKNFKDRYTQLIKEYHKTKVSYGSL